MTRLWGLLAAGVVIFALWGCDDEPDPVNCDAVANPCDNAGDLRCDPTDDMVVEECVEGGDGCLQWSESETCGANQVCGDASCECENTCEEADVGVAFCDGEIVVECVRDEDGCTVEDDQRDCADSGQECDDTSGPADCVGCENQCETQSELQCSGASIIQICEEQADGCLDWEEYLDCDANDPPQVCDDTGGTPDCVDECTDVCLVVDETQCLGEVIQTCAVQENGCMDWESGDDCSTHDPAQFCDDTTGEALCTDGCLNQCTDGITQCNGDFIQTCAVQTSGCTDWDDTTDCSAETPSQICDDSSGTPVCREPAGGSCADPVVVSSLPFDVFGDDITADFMNDQTFGGTDCVSYADTVEAVFAVDLVTDEQLVVIEYGAVDVIVSLQTTCGDAEACEFSDDFGELDGHLYTATADGTVYVIIETYSSSPVFVDYGVFIDLVGAEICDDGEDNDYDSYVDCNDFDCDGVSPCEDPEVTCDDLFDNDGDGAIDCVDSDCAGVSPCEATEATCDDSIDNDGDGATDCDDTDCFSAACAPEVNCTDGLDNDGDGDSDCEDADCAADVFCTTPGGCTTPVVVDSFPFAVTGADFTADYLDQQLLAGTDCYVLGDQEDAVFAVDLSEGETILVSEHGGLDATLNVQESCGNEEACAFGVDLGGDESGGRIFTATADGTFYVIVENWYPAFGDTDYDIRIELVPPESDCGDDIDNDLDGSTDCDDSDCFGDATHCTTETNCNDGFDNDDDGSTDCADADCAAETFCEDPEATCDDDFDNDSDGDVDCDDSDCTADVYCTTEGSCRLPVVVDSTPFAVTGADFTADYFNQQSLNDDSCYGRSGDQVEAVFEVSLTAGQSIRLSEHGGLDATLNLQVAACGNDEVCEFGVDLGTDESGGVIYMATEDVTVYAIVESWSSSPSSTDYDIRIEEYFPPPPVINELGYDNDSTDNMEFVEIYFPDGVMDLTGYSLVHLNGNGGGELWSADLTGFGTDSDGFFVIGPAALAAADAHWFDDFSIDDADEEDIIQNGPDALVLYWDYGGGDEAVVDAVAYEGVDDLPAEAVETTPSGALHGSEQTSLGRYPDGEDTDDNSADVGRAWFLSPGEPNFPHDPDGYSRVSSLTSHSSDTFPIEVPDNTVPGPSSTIVIADSDTWWPETLADVMVGVRISHAYIGDVEMTLTSPDGTVVILHDNTGGSDDNIVTVYDDVTAVADTVETMDSFAGENGRGTWTLNVTDNAGGIGGSILEWYVLVN